MLERSLQLLKLSRIKLSKPENYVLTIAYVICCTVLDPECVGEGVSVICPEDLVEICSDGKCECLEGMRRSAATQKCEWRIDIVCQKVILASYQ